MGIAMATSTVSLRQIKVELHVSLFVPHRRFFADLAGDSFAGR